MQSIQPFNPSYPILQQYCATNQLTAGTHMVEWQPASSLGWQDPSRVNTPTCWIDCNGQLHCSTPCSTAFSSGCVGSGGSNVNVNGLTVPAANFNSVAPLPDFGYTVLKWKAIGSNVIAEGVFPFSIGPVTNQWVNSYNQSTASFTTSQPSVTNLSDTPAAHNVLAGPARFAGPPATATFRLLNPGDIPAGLTSCAILDNAICTSSVNASGNPNFLEIDATPPGVDVDGSVTPLTYFVAGYYQQITSKLTVTPVTPASDKEYFILVKRDITNSNPVSSDLVATTIPPTASYTAPTCSSSATSSNPHYWFSLAANVMKVCTSSGGSFTVAVTPVLPLGVAIVSSTPVVQGVLCEPYRLNPYQRFQMFGNGTTQLVVTGAQTENGLQNFNSVSIDGGSAVLHHSAHAATACQWCGLVIRSQNPVLIINSGAINVIGDGLPQTANGGTTTGAAAFAGNGLLAGTGGGGGGSAASAGGAGGGIYADFFMWGYIGSDTTKAGGTGGTTSSGNGGTGVSNTAYTYQSNYGLWMANGLGTAGGNGAGDGVNNGGNGGSGGGTVVMVAPSIYVGAGSVLDASGAVGLSPAAGNTGGGGGGGGGTLILAAGFVSQNGTLQSNGGAYGTSFGTGGHGGVGGAGTAAAVELW